MAFRIAELYAEFRARGLAQMSASMKGLRAGLAQTSVAMSRLAAHVKIASMAAVGMLGIGVWQAVKFENQMAHVATMLNKVSMAELPALSKGIRKMAIDFGQSTEALTSGLFDFLSASFSTQDAMAALEVSSKLATGGFTDAGKTTKTLIATLNSFGIAGRDAIKVSDMMFASYQKGVFTMEELASTLGTVTSTASMAGIPLAELLAMISAVTQKGVPMHQTMTGVIGVMMSFTKATEDAKVEFEKLFDKPMTLASLKTIGLSNLFKKLNELTADQVAIMFPNRRAIKAVAAALKDAGLVAEHYNYILNATGGTEDALAKATNTASFQFRQLKEIFLEVMRSAGDALLPTIKQINSGMKKLADNRALLGMLSNIVVKAGLAGAALLALGLAIKILIPMVLLLKGVLIMAFAVLGALTSPIGLVVAGLIGLGAYLLWTSGVGAKALAWLGEKFGVLKGIALQAFIGIKDALAAGDIAMAAKILWAGLLVVWEKGTGQLLRVWLDFKGWFLKIAYGAFYGMLRVAEETWHALRIAWIETTSALETGWAGFAASVSTVWYAAGAQLRKEWSILSIAWIEFGGLLQTEWARATANIRKIWAVAQAGLERSWLMARAVWERAWDSIPAQMALKILGAMWDWVANKARSAFKDMIRFAYDAEAVFTSLTRVIASRWQRLFSILGLFSKKAAKAGAAAGDIVKAAGLRAPGSKVIEDVKNAYEQAKERVKKESEQIDADLKKRLTAIEDERKAAQKSIEDQRATGRAAETERHKQRLKGLDEEQRKVEVQIGAEKAERIKAAKAKEAKAKAAFDKFTEDAAITVMNQEREASEAAFGKAMIVGGPPGAPGGPEAPGPPKITAMLDRGSWSGLADVWKNIQSSILKVDPALAEAKKQTTWLEKIAGNTEDGVGGAATVAAGGT